MAAVSLLQTGIVQHLSDPPLGDFDSDKVNSSNVAYMLGVPDGTLSLASLAANIRMAAYGGEKRSQEKPLIALQPAKRPSKQPSRPGTSIKCPPRKRSGVPIASPEHSRISGSSRSHCLKLRKRSLLCERIAADAEPQLSRPASNAASRELMM